MPGKYRSNSKGRRKTTGSAGALARNEREARKDCGGKLENCAGPQRGAGGAPALPVLTSFVP